MWCREVCLSGLFVVADLWKDDPLHVTGAVFCLICEWTMPLSQLRTLPPLHTSAVSWHSKDHGIRASLLHDPSVSRTSALRWSSKKWCDQCFVRFITSRCWYNYNDNDYNNSLALYLHYLSLILMLFIVLLARGMSDHSVMSHFWQKAHPFFHLWSLLWNGTHDNDFLTFTNSSPELQVWS